MSTIIQETLVQRLLREYFLELAELNIATDYQEIREDEFEEISSQVVAKYADKIVKAMIE